ncbi:hypothetical protein Tco_0865467 [Tanacetum coccineum]
MSKAKRSTFKTKTVPSLKGRLHFLHMEFYGPMWVESINGKKYILISKKARILELKRRYLKITVLTPNTPYPSRKIRRICACTSQKTTKETRSIRLIMTKVIKGEFEKLESVNISNVSLTCKTSLEIFNEEFIRMSRMKDDLFTYEVEIAEVTNIPCDLKKEDDSEQQMSHESDDDMEYDPSDVEFTECLASKFFNYKTMDHYTMKALWIYWARGDDEVELTDEESSDSDDEDEVAKIFRIETNTYEEYKDDWIYEWNKDVPWVHEKPWTDNGVWKEPTPVKHHCNPFNYKSGCSEWPTCSWKDDGYCNGGNFPGAYIVGNTLRYQDLEWYDALKDSKLKEEALKNKAIMEGMIDEDEQSSNEGWRRWDDFDNTNHDNKNENEMEHEEFDDSLFNSAVHIVIIVINPRYKDLNNLSLNDHKSYQII